MLKDIYYYFEGGYYDILDRVEQYIPIYSITDPIDRVIPSFIVCLILVFLLAALLVFGVLSLMGGGLFAQQDAQFFVGDSASNPLANVVVTFSLNGKSDAKTTDATGAFTTTFYGTNTAITAKGTGLVPYNRVRTIEPGTQYTITMQYAGNGPGIGNNDQNSATFRGGARTLTFALVDETGASLPSTANVTLTFSCSGNISAPAAVTGLGPAQRVIAQDNCGSLTTIASALGYTPGRKVVTVANQTSPITIALTTQTVQNTTAKIAVYVKDTDSRLGVADIPLTLRNGAIKVNQSMTDASGSALFENVTAGTYTVEATPPLTLKYPSSVTSTSITIGSVEVLAGSTKSVTLNLTKLTGSKKIMLHFTDAQSNDPVSDVQAVLAIDGNLSSIIQTSTSQGLVTFENLESTRTYAVIASHPSYILAIVSNPAVVPTSATAPQEIKLTKATGANSGLAHAMVSMNGSSLVSSASTILYSPAFSFPLGTKMTGASGAQVGIADYNNLPLYLDSNTTTQATYFAYGEKSIGTITYKNESLTKNFFDGNIAPNTMSLPITLVAANANVQVTVQDENGVKIQNARVSFYNSADGSKLVNDKNTDNRGYAVAPIIPSIKPYVHVEKVGYYPYNTASMTLVSNGTTAKTIVLKKENSTDSFDITLNGITTPSGGIVAKVSKGTTYLASFTLFAPQDANDVETVIRTGLESQNNAMASTMTINAGSIALYNTNTTTYSSCFDPTDNFANCHPELTDTIAKQVVSKMTTLPRGVYEMKVLVTIRTDADDNAPIEIRYGTHADVNGTTLYRETAGKLYLWQTRIGQLFCLGDACGIVFSFSYNDKNAIFVPLKTPIAEGSTTTLINGQAYTVQYSIANISKSLFDNVALTPTVANNATSQLPLLTPVPITLGRMAPNSSFEGTIDLNAASAISSARLDFNLNTTRTDGSASLYFRIPSLATITVSVAPNFIKPNTPNQYIVVKATNLAGVPLSGAQIKVGLKDSNTYFLFGNAYGTDSNGQMTLVLEQAYDAGTQFDVTVTKPGYRAQVKTITIGIIPGSQVALSCLSVDGAPIENLVKTISSRGGTSGYFQVRNDSCGTITPIQFAIDKYADSDINLSKASDAAGSNDAAYTFGTYVTLAQGESAYFNAHAAKEFGVHPLYVSVKLTSTSPVLQAGVGRVVVSAANADPNTKVCLKVISGSGTAKNPYLVNLLDGTQDVNVENSCYTGYPIVIDEFKNFNEPTKYPSDPYGSFSNTQLLINYANEAKSGSTSDRAYIVRNIGLTENNFFLITVEDYICGGEALCSHIN